MSKNLVGQGQLELNVFAVEKGVPLDWATVKITNGATGEVLEELRTDLSGQTPSIVLPTPALDYSLHESEQRPYATYNATIRHPDFQTLHIAAIQIMPQSTSLQQAILSPATASGFNVQNTLVAPHTLWGEYPEKIPEDEVKPLPDATGLIVLSEPVIPKYIIVHLGRPTDASAQNVWVTFKDYIKNVASSEIYSTWTQETIRANVLAILSFTLNRVYTEWYRGKGYDFTITNSTAFDHAYQHGRTIFREIAEIVDELFTTYVTKPNISQPLFTQYCDGRRVQCKGLSQWGSQTLGAQGQSALHILKNYYGSDIYLEQAQKVSGVPLSYGGEVLTIGSTGTDVQTIQSQLNRISDNYPAIPKLRVDSVYGNATADAVRKFQKIFHLPETGSVDFSTWYEISNIYVAVSKMA